MTAPPAAPHSDLAALWPRLSLALFYALICAGLALLTLGIGLTGQQMQRGIWRAGDPLPPASAAPSPLGTTVDLLQYEEDAALDAALDSAEAMGLHWLRQELRWDLVEATAGQPRWAAYDRVIDAASARGFDLILYLNRTPAWARRSGEEENPLAPPADTAEFVDFVAAAADRYGPQVYGWQIWDEPNLMHWGQRIIQIPDEYGAFLAATVPAIRAADPDAVVATAGLGSTSEREGYNMSEVTYLRWLYDSGADQWFDAVALKPFGFWNDVADREYSEEILGIDRVVLTRELMVQRGDGATPIWFVEGGWAILPEWQSEPPPWSYDAPPVQQRRLFETVNRATLEWPFVQVIGLQLLQPDLPRDDPRWALALRGPDDELTALGQWMGVVGTRYINGPLGEWQRAVWEGWLWPRFVRYDYATWLLLALTTLLAARGLWHFSHLPWRAMGSAFRRWPEVGQVGLIALAVAAFYFTDNRAVILLIAGMLGLLFSWRYDLGLATVAFALPFYLQTKQFPGLQFSMVELMLLLCAALWWAKLAWQLWQRRGARGPLLRERLLPRDALDWAVIALVIVAALSLLWSLRFGVAAREFRVVVLESAIWYWLLRHSGLSAAQRWRVVDGLVLAGTLVSLYGLYQWLFTPNIIQAEGVRRILGTYLSPNNLALYLERVLPLTIAVALLAPSGPRRRRYGLAMLPMGLTLLLTFSRGAWLLGIPAMLLWLAWWGGARARRGALVVLAVGVLALLPFAATERFSTLINFNEGTWAIRRSLWRATINMLRDYPLTGVGMDNFLYLYRDQYILLDTPAWREPNLNHPHQIVLHFWVALGVPGLILLFGQQIAYWRTWLRQQRRLLANSAERALLIGLGASMAATIAHGLIDNSFFLVDLAFVWMLNLAVVAGLGEDREGR